VRQSRNARITPLAFEVSPLRWRPRMDHYFAVFTTLIVTPFEHIKLVWGIVPLYFGLLLNELASAKANFRTAIQTGFSFLWAGVQWLYPYFASDSDGGHRLEVGDLSINLLVTVLVLAMGVIALVSGLRKRFPKYARFLGHTRFANYFMIAIYPMQAHALAWTWTRLFTVIIFALPVWVALHFGLMPFRGRR
jgi:hypothetical protein